MTDFRGGTRKTFIAVVLCALAVSGCTAAEQPSGPVAASRVVSEPPSPSGPLGGDGTASTGGLNATDVGWIQLTIAMDDQARHILELAAERSGNRHLKTWAAGTAERHRERLATLRALLAEEGLPDDNPHEGHDMPGMVNARELQALETARGPRFDRLLRSAMLEHLDQSRKLAAAVRKADADSDVKRVALATDTAAAEARRTLPSP
ncbi:DUF305 domain-containing protein [Streptomyces sp. NPDC086081]|uniref:DUF305 domain-containing protein n=1 Tax=Streptomyces sp. NPDC086081 TaxID=3365749 RepID=UPI0038131140